MKQIFIIKVSILIILLSSSLFSGSISAAKITDMVSKIKKERSGIALAKLESTANPFIIRVPQEKVVDDVGMDIPVDVPVQVNYTLKAILNHAAFINKKWYKQGDSIGNYKIGYVSSHSVELKNANENRILSLDKKKKNFIKLNRGDK
ncbi:MAG: Unknown protein [uncultured Sulfurovum sp.]|uniref:Uncharacterized protein n=1 Tax=uncultured Sulfurovum sp. TaxID=269237 RepID=A0A6S6TJJ4_9BACT|nr:MAG: Unknown protein [uncultured Sulfurovum sp.]